jgi:hypothetical protein
LFCCFMCCLHNYILWITTTNHVLFVAFFLEISIKMVSKHFWTQLENIHIGLCKCIWQIFTLTSCKC